MLLEESIVPNKEYDRGAQKESALRVSESIDFRVAQLSGASRFR